MPQWNWWAGRPVKPRTRPKVMPRAINTVVFRIAVFYVGSLVLLALLLPYTTYKQGTSPFVTFFSSIGVPAPFAGIALTARFTVAGVFLNLVVPSEAFNIALDLSALGIIASWATIVICQIQLFRWSKRGIVAREAFRTRVTPPWCSWSP
jgi:L-asparagine permease